MKVRVASHLVVRLGWLCCLILLFSVNACQTTEVKTKPSHVMTWLFFGLNKPGGTVSDKDWEAFLDKEVTPRFPDGCTVLDARGRWQNRETKVVEREASKVLLLLRPNNEQSKERVDKIIERYKIIHEQQSVLEVTQPVKRSY